MNSRVKDESHHLQPDCSFFDTFLLSCATARVFLSGFVINLALLLWLPYLGFMASD